jgi:hypothetical protein
MCTVCTKRRHKMWRSNPTSCFMFQVGICRLDFKHGCIDTSPAVCYYAYMCLCNLVNMYTHFRGSSPLSGPNWSCYPKVAFGIEAKQNTHTLPASVTVMYTKHRTHFTTFSLLILLAISRIGPFFTWKRIRLLNSPNLSYSFNYIWAAVEIAAWNNNEWIDDQKYVPKIILCLVFF